MVSLPIFTLRWVLSPNTQQDSETQYYAGIFDIKRFRSMISRRTVILIKLQRKSSVNPYTIIATQCPILVFIPKIQNKLQEGSVFYNYCLIIKG